MKSLLKKQLTLSGASHFLQKTSLKETDISGPVIGNCIVCNKLEKLQRQGVCSTYCWNKTRYKGIDGYRKCKNCPKEFPYRNSLKIRGCFSKKEGRIIASKKQEFCSHQCSLRYRNKYKNPAQTPQARKINSEKAKLRDHSHLRTPGARRKMSETISGKGHWNWQGGKTPENKRRRNLAEYQVWRISIFERDNYTCVFCGKRGGYLEADHIKPWAKYPELRLSKENGRTLCKPCHKTTDTYAGNLR